MKPLAPLALAAALLAAPAGVPQPTADNEVRNVRLELRQVLAGDSLTFRLRWLPPPRGRLTTPVTGFEWQFSASPPASVTFDDPNATGSGGEDLREARTTLFHDCANGTLWYAARVRALGAWDPDEAPWGVSVPVEIACDDSPPGPPEVQLDTLPVDTVASPPPDSLHFAVTPVTYPTLTDALAGELSPAWTIVGEPEVWSDGLAGGPTGGLLYATAPVGTEQVAEVRVTYRGPEGIGGPVVRLDPRAESYYRLQWADGPGVYQLRRVDASASVLGAWRPDQAPRSGDVDVLGLEAHTRGAAVELRGSVRGIERIVVRDAAALDGRHVGLSLATDPGGVRPVYRDFEGGPLARSDHVTVAGSPGPLERLQVRYTALGTVARWCAWSWRDGRRLRASRQVAELPPLRPVDARHSPPAASLHIDTLATAQACWDVHALPRID